MGIGAEALGTGSEWGRTRRRSTVRQTPRALGRCSLGVIRPQRGVHYLLIYDLAPDYLERRAALRSEHLRLAWQAQENGALLLGGALAEPVDTAVLLFRSDSPAVAEKFAAVDPYVRHGLVTKWRVRPWNTVVGDAPASPVRP